MPYPSTAVSTAAAAVAVAAAAREHHHHQQQQRQQHQQQAVTPQWKQLRGSSESVFKTAVFLGSMIVVAILLLVLICMARWDSIVRLVPVFNSEVGRWRWRRSNNLQRQSTTRSNSRHHNHDLESSAEPVLSTSLSKKNRGSNKRVVEALPIINYVSAPAAAAAAVSASSASASSASVSDTAELSCLLGTECTICLCDFVDGDRVRLLPDCCHGFHVECVDVWLIAHASCPSCRNNLHKSAAEVPPRQHFPSASSSSAAAASTVA